MLSRPAAVQRAVRSAGRRLPGLQRVALRARFGDLGRTHGVSSWGTQRGTPVDRWYIERFLDRHADVVRGRVLEVKQDTYASRLGASEVEVVDIDPANAHANVVGDLCDPGTLQEGRYDAAIVTQTLQLVDDPPAAVRNVLRSLRPGGSLLVTVPCVSRLAGSGDLWRWTPAGLRAVLAPIAPQDAAWEVVGMGNGLSSRAFLFGLAAEDLDPRALAVDEVDYPFVVAAVVRTAS